MANDTEYDNLGNDAANSDSRTSPARDAARIAPLADAHDFEVADGVRDPRGWDVVAADGQRVGSVHDLIVDTAARRTRYVDVRLSSDLGGRNEDVLIPVGLVRMADSDDQLRLDTLSTSQVAALPAYDHGTITRDTERRVLNAIPSAGAAPMADRVIQESDADFYANRHFDDSRFVAHPQPRSSATSTASTGGRTVGEGVGGASGLVVGGIIGSVGGPIGTLIGAIAGVIGGWWAGREVADAATSYTGEHDATYRRGFDSLSPSDRAAFGSFDRARPAYQLGHVAARNPDYTGRSFDQVEPDLRRAWNPDLERQYGPWSAVRGPASTAYNANRSNTSSTNTARPNPTGSQF